MAFIIERGGKFWVRWREGGRGGVNRSITVSTRKAADRLKVEVEDALERTGRYEPRRPGRSTPLEVILVDYTKWSMRVHRPNTTRRIAQVLELFRRWVGVKALAEHLTYELLGDYHAHLERPETGRHLHRRGSETIRKHLEAIEVWWQWAWDQQARGVYVGVPQPIRLGLRREPAPTKRAPTWAEMDAAIGVSDGWQHDLYVVLRCTGLRVQQALELRWSDFRLDLEVPILHVRPELGKSRQERRGRWVPVAPVLVRELERLARDGDHVVGCARDRREARARDAARAWARAGVDPVVCEQPHHAFRAGFTTGLKRLGADVEAVEYLTGRSLGVRDRYLDPDALPLVQAVELVPEIGSTTEERTAGVHRGGTAPALRVVSQE